MRGEKLQSIQGLRFVAASAVVYHHACILALVVCGSFGILGAGNLPGIGAAGVDIFFVISGLVITLTGPLADPRPSGAQFFWRRLTRVAPMFWLMTIPALMTLSITGPMSAYGAGGPMNVAQNIATLLFWPATESQIVAPYVSQGWTLCFEMVFYTAVSFVLLGGRMKRNAAILAVVIVIAVLARWVTGWAWLRILANRMFIEFGYGVVLAFGLGWLRQRGPRLAIPLLLIGLGFYAYAGVKGDLGVDGWLQTMSDSVSMVRVFIFGTPAVFVVAGALILEPYFRGRLARICVALGNASYSIYLVHALILLGMLQLWSMTKIHAPAFLVLLSGLAVGIGAGVVAHLWVERPLQWAVRWLSTQLMSLWTAKLVAPKTPA